MVSITRKMDLLSLFGRYMMLMNQESKLLGINGSS